MWVVKVRNLIFVFVNYLAIVIVVLVEYIINCIGIVIVVGVVIVGIVVINGNYYVVEVWALVIYWV